MIDENKVRESFAKIRNDMFFLSQEIMILRQEINEIRQILKSSTYPAQDRHTTHIPAHNLTNYALNQPKLEVSRGNEGVPADRQHIDNRHIIPLKRTSERPHRDQERLQYSKEYSREFSEISTLIHNLKQDLGKKFKKLTQKEFLIFSTLYTLEEELKNVTYNDLAQHTDLTESSIRDYISRLIHKGIPIIKQKLNNKLTILRIPKELKDLATLDKLSRLKGF